MAIPTPAIPTFTDGQLVNASNLNALGSNLTNLYTYNQAGFTSQRPAVIAKQTTGQSIPNTTDTIVNFQSAAVNTDNMWTASVANQVTIQHAGIYWVFSQMRYPAIGTGAFTAVQTSTLMANSTTSSIATNAIVAPGAGAGSGMPTGCLINLAAGATLYLNAWHSMGAATTLLTNFGGTYLGAVFLTPST